MSLRLASCWAVLAGLGLLAHWISRDAVPPLARVEPVRTSPEISLPWPERRCVEIDLEVLRTPPRGGRPSLWLELVDEGGGVVRTFDSPVGCWMPGTSTRQRVVLDQSRLSPPLEPGVHRLEAGLRDPESAGRWTVEDAGAVGERFEVGVVTVPEPVEAVLPDLEWFGSWGLPTPTADGRHEPDSRLLLGAGGFEVGASPHGGWMRWTLRVSSPREGIEMSSTCSPERQRLDVGLATIEQEVPPEGCRVEFLRTSSAEAARPLGRLESWTWRGGAGP